MQKLFKGRIRAKEREEMYKELEQADKQGKTLKDVLAARNAEKNGQGTQHSGSKAA